MPRWFIESVDVSGGFLAGLSLELPRGLTCVIGPRGSGKSTLAEALRFAFLGTAGAGRPRLDLIQANLGSSCQIAVRTKQDGAGAGYLIRRSHKQPAVLTTVDGKAVTNVDLDRGTFLPIDVYNSVEIEGIADESVGERRRALLDELRADALREIGLSLGNRRRALESNAAQIEAAERLVSDLTEQIEELGDARARLRALPAPPENVNADRLSLASRQNQANAREKRNLAAAEALLTRLGRDLSQVADEGRRGLSQDLAVDGSANGAIVGEAQRVLEDVVIAANESILRITQDLGRAADELGRIRERVEAAHAGQAEEYGRLEHEDLAAGQTVRERAAAEQAVARLGELEQKREEAGAEVRRLTAEREALKEAYRRDRARVTELRREVAAELQREVGRSVRLQVLPGADDGAYRQMLAEGLKGARVRNHEEIIDKLAGLDPSYMARLIREADEEELDLNAGLGRERALKILEAFRAGVNPFELEAVGMEDRVGIELNVATDGGENFKDAAELSRGQKCTAILPLLLARRDTPLVIDQPEDNLDNHFIYETVVESIRRLKPHRQMVFITHNANIPVLAEAELVVVLNSDGQRGYVSKAGSLDECREEIVDLLEGGRVAFDLRRQRYARP